MAYVPAMLMPGGLPSIEVRPVNMSNVTHKEGWRADRPADSLLARSLFVGKAAPSKPKRATTSHSKILAGLLSPHRKHA